MVFTVKVPRPGSRALSGSMPRLSGRTISAVVAQALPEEFDPGPQEQSPQVSDRAVEAEFVFGRHAATELSVAYAILVPQRQARIVRAGQEGRPPRDERGDLRPGLQRPAEEGRDDRVADRGAARARRAGRSRRPGRVGLRRRGPFRGDAGPPGPGGAAGPGRPGLPGRGAAATPRTGWPASSPTRRCCWRNSPAPGSGWSSSRARAATPRKTSRWCSSRASSPSTRKRSRWPSGTGAARPTAPAPGRSTCCPSPRSATGTSARPTFAAPPTRSSSTRRPWSRSCSAATPTTAPPSPTWPAG